MFDPTLCLIPSLSFSLVSLPYILSLVDCMYVLTLIVVTFRVWAQAYPIVARRDSVGALAGSDHPRPKQAIQGTQTLTYVSSVLAQWQKYLLRCSAYHCNWVLVH